MTPPSGRLDGADPVLPAKRVLRPATTRRVDAVTQHLVAVTFAGPGLDGFELTDPAQHIQVFLPDRDGTGLELVDGDGGRVFAPAHPRPTVRTYTPRRFDPQSGELEVLFLVNGAGPGSAWAAAAEPGAPVVIGGPAGGYTVDAGVTRYVLAGDESALPAIATILEALPASAEAEVHAEVPAGETELALSSPAPFTVRWWPRAAGARAGDALVRVLTDEATVGRHLAEAPDSRFWMAGEAAASRRIRRYLIDDHHLDRTRAYTRAYWKYGKGSDPGPG
ncbi:MAG: siderophore-interacting protein [Actinomycetota bacterium]|nr:siderophore-interacting protein [Actinomycetota bacterium]